MKWIAVTAAFVCLAGCSSKEDPSEANFGAAMEAYLAKKGSLCLNNETWPSEMTEAERKFTASINGGNASGFKALESAGLISSSQAEKEILSFGGKATGRTQTVTRYDLTEQGKAFFKEAKGGLRSAKSGEIRGALCYGNKALAEVIKWEGPMKLGDYQEAKVFYHYKIDELADWAKSEEIQAAYPRVQEWIEGAGTKQQTHAVHLTSIGWEANGIDG